MVVSPSLAANTVTANVKPGARSASINDAVLPAVDYSDSAQVTSGTMELTAQDSSGTGLGWSVTVLSSKFVYEGQYAGSDIPASNLLLTSAAAPTAVSGQAVDATGGPKVPLTSPLGPLSSARKTVQALAGFGKGTYTQALGVSLTFPGQSLAGKYTATLTVTVAAGP